MGTNIGDDMGNDMGQNAGKAPEKALGAAPGKALAEILRQDADARSHSTFAARLSEPPTPLFEPFR